MDIDEYCAFCGTKLVHRNELVYDDSFLGISYPLKMLEMRRICFWLKYI